MLLFWHELFIRPQLFQIQPQWSPMVPPNLFILFIDSTFVGPVTYLPTSCPQSSPTTSISANILVYQWSLNSALWCWHYGPLLWKLPTIVPSREYSSHQYCRQVMYIAHTKNSPKYTFRGYITSPNSSTQLTINHQLIQSTVWSQPCTVTAN